MSDDREARRLAVEAAARELATAWTDHAWHTGQMEALRAAVRRLDAPRYEVRACLAGWEVSIQITEVTRRVIAVAAIMADAERIAALLNDAEGR